MERDFGDEVPGCTGGLASTTDFCIYEKYATGGMDEGEAEDLEELEQELEQEEQEEAGTPAPTEADSIGGTFAETFMMTTMDPETTAPSDSLSSEIEK